MVNLSFDWNGNPYIIVMIICHNGGLVMINRKLFILFSVIAVFAILSIYYSLILQGNAPPRRVVLRIATTTSLDATGLLDAIKHDFESRYSWINVTWVAVGTGQAVEIGKRGDVDLIIIHNRDLENNFILSGYGVHGVSFAYNDFIIVGPPDDPANVSRSASVVEAFRRIYYAGVYGKALFISRGDRSGTHLKELSIWNATGLNPSGMSWYREVGQGMSQTLMVADGLNAYTLSDRSTYMAFKDKLNLKLLFEGDPSLLNIYRVIIVNPSKFPWVHYDEACLYVKFLISSEGQSLIENYSRGGVKLFHACFGRLKELGINDPYEESEVNYWRGKLSNP